MRHTFHTWCDHFANDPGLQSKVTSSTWGIDNKAAGVANRWADQDAVFTFVDGAVMRASFRFLHGSTSEFLYKAANWHSMQVYGEFEDQDSVRCYGLAG